MSVDEDDVLVIPRTKANKIAFPEIVVAKNYGGVSVELGDGAEQISFGVYATADKRICVAGDIPLPQYLHVLFHELTHWVQDEVGELMSEDMADDFADKVYQAIEWKLPDELKEEEERNG